MSGRISIVSSPDSPHGNKWEVLSRTTIPGRTTQYAEVKPLPNSERYWGWEGTNRTIAYGGDLLTCVTQSSGFYSSGRSVGVTYVYRLDESGWTPINTVNTFQDPATQYSNDDGTGIFYHPKLFSAHGNLYSVSYIGRYDAGSSSSLKYRRPRIHRYNGSNSWSLAWDAPDPIIMSSNGAREVVDIVALQNEPYALVTSEGTTQIQYELWSLSSLSRVALSGMVSKSNASSAAVISGTLYVLRNDGTYLTYSQSSGFSSLESTGFSGPTAALSKIYEIDDRPSFVLQSSSSTAANRGTPQLAQRSPGGAWTFSTINELERYKRWISQIIFPDTMYNVQRWPHNEAGQVVGRKIADWDDLRSGAITELGGGGIPESDYSEPYDAFIAGNYFYVVMQTGIVFDYRSLVYARVAI